MLRVGLTGELGSGKSTVARMLADLGAVVFSSDEMGRAMMQPGEPVYQAIVAHFGPTIVLPDGALDRRELARLAFHPEHPRVEELNAIVHPAVIAEQERRIEQIAREQPDAIVVIESALIFTTKHAGGDEPWRRRFDYVVVVTAPDEMKIERFVLRSAAGRKLTRSEEESLQSDARARLTAQRVSLAYQSHCLVLANDQDVEALASRTEEVYQELRRRADDVQV